MNQMQNNNLDSSTDAEDKSVYDLAEHLWDYVHLNQNLLDQNSELTGGYILALGSTDEKTAIRAGNLFLEGDFEGIICSGGTEPKQFIEKFGKPLTEAEVFASIIEKMGVGRVNIQLETEAHNTKENILFSLRLLEKRGESENKPIILVCAPTQERRVLATAKKIDSLTDWRVTSSPISFKEYINSPLQEGRINALMGQIIRLKLYGIKGDIEPQNIPEDVEDAYRELYQKGYLPIALESITEDMEKYGVNVDLSVKEEQDITREYYPSSELKI